MKLGVYLNFQGQTKEVLAHYARAFNSIPSKLLLYKDAPAGVDHLTEEQKEYVMHSFIMVGENQVMISDLHRPLSSGNNMSVVFTSDKEKEVQQAYDVLTEEGTITTALGKSFFSEMFAVVTDKFGVSWLIMLQKQ